MRTIPLRVTDQKSTNAYNCQALIDFWAPITPKETEKEKLIDNLQLYKNLLLDETL